MAPSHSTEPAARGSCAGFGIRSELAFATLREGGGASLRVAEETAPAPSGEVLARWQPRPGNPFHGHLSRDGAGYAFWASDAGWYRIDAAGSTITVEPGGDPFRRELRLFGIPAAVCAMQAGDLALHASAVEIGGRAVLFAGPSMHGKTTLAAALAARGHRLLAEDTIRCSLAEVPEAYPGPAVVRLRADVVRSLAVPDVAAVAPDEEGRTPLVFAPAVRGSGAPVPIAAVVFLRTDAGQPRLDAVEAGAAAARDLFALAFRLPTDASRAACFAQVVDLATRVDVLDLSRPMTFAALPAVIALLEDRIAR
jgi:hypothetical protein